jgi:outer membrane protein TolC
MLKGLAFLVSILIDISLMAQTRFTGLEELLRYADKNTVTARQTLLERSVAELDHSIARSGVLPKLTVYGSGEYYPVLATQLIPESIFGGAPDKFRKVQFGLPFAVSTGAEITVPVINLEKWAQLEKSRLLQMQTNWSGEARMEDLHIQLTEFYFQALLSGALVQLNAESIRIAKQLMTVMDERKKSGILNPSDYNRSSNLELDVEAGGPTYEKLMRQSTIALRALLNLPDSSTIEIADSLDSFSWPLLAENRNLNDRPGWKEAEARVKVSEQTLLESRRSALPKLSFYGRYSYNWQFKDAQTAAFDVSTLGLRLDYTIFNGSNIRNQQKKNLLLLQSAQLQREGTRSSLTRQEQDWENGYFTAFQKRMILDQKLAVAKDNLRIGVLNLDEGTMEFDEFYNIFMDYVRARQDQLQNLSDGILYYVLITHNLK